nr:hypothetical protein [Tanacetum cinerariifolium]
MNPIATQQAALNNALVPPEKRLKIERCSQAYKTYYEFAIGKVPPKKARNYKKVALPLRKLSPVKEAEPVKKGKRVKRHVKKSTTRPTFNTPKFTRSDIYNMGVNS